MMKYAKNWAYLESKIVKPQASFPQGAIRDGQRFYVAYLDSSQRINNQWKMNTHLAAYNSNWNLLEDVAATSYSPGDQKDVTSPWVMQHGNQLFVSYVVANLNPDGSLDDHSFQTYVKVYELAHTAYLPLVLRNYDGNCPGGYGKTGEGMGLVSVRRSTDGGVTWEDLGHACLNSNSISPADPSPLAIDVGAALFIFDGATGQTSPTILRATTTDGTHFTAFEPAIVYPDGLTDPFILQMPNGCRMYFSAAPGNMSAWSDDCITFTVEAGARTGQMGAPGALLLPDGRVRLFGSGDWESEHGILSFISNDGGLTFTQEPGLRIGMVDGFPPGAQHPTSLRQGGYIMAFHVTPPGQDPVGNVTYIARSADAFTWTVDRNPVGLADMPGLVELEDSTLLLYYVDFNY
jgi:hypothetical protein